jgi:predicted nuclease of predicted toxin-antitoxin system
MLRLIVNENMPDSVSQELRSRGHDVLAVKESMRGDDDASILARAQVEQRIVVTQDKDFGELAFRYGLAATCGVVLFRLSGANPDVDRQRMLEAIESRSDWSGWFTVVTDDRIRMRPLPPGPST